MTFVLASLCYFTSVVGFPFANDPFRRCDRAAPWDFCSTSPKGPKCEWFRVSARFGGRVTRDEVKTLKAGIPKHVIEELCLMVFQFCF